MKLKLLFQFFLLSAVSVTAQSPINNFYLPQDAVSYAIVRSEVPLAQETSGANSNWDFSQLTQIGSSEVRTVPPTTEELATYWNTTAVTTTVSTMGSEDFSNKLFSRTTGQTVSITGVNTSQIQLIYDLDNAVLGDFPLSYGYTNSDGVSGTYFAEGGYSDQFHGNSTTTVDAFGTLTLNVGSVPALTNVTRLKTTQNISLDYLFLTDVGTVTQTIYSYYQDGSPLSVPVFRSTHTNINVPTLNIDDTSETLEVFESVLLGEKGFTKPDFRIAPNPATDFLSVQAGNRETISSVKIADMNGRIVLKADIAKNIDIRQLQNGIYVATITTDKGDFTQKIIKK